MFIDLRVMVRMDPTLCENHGLLCEAEEECSLCPEHPIHRIVLMTL